MVVRERLIEGDEQGVGVANVSGEKRGANDLVEFGEGEWGEFDGVVVVEGEEWFGGGVEGLDLWRRGHGAAADRIRRKSGRREDLPQRHRAKKRTVRKRFTRRRVGGDNFA